MKQILNESAIGGYCLNISLLKQDYPDVSFNAIRDKLTDMGATVKGGPDNVNNIIMQIIGLPAARVMRVFNQFGISDADEYIADDDALIPEYEEPSSADVIDANDEPDYPPYDDNDDDDDDDDDLDYPAYDDVDVSPVTEKRKGCCPPNKVPLSEALKAYKEKDLARLDDIEKNINKAKDQLKGLDISDYLVRSAIAKLKKENDKLSKIQKSEDDMFSLADIKGIKKLLMSLKKNNPGTASDIEKLIARMDKNLKEKNNALYDCKINGKSMKECSDKELKECFKRVLKLKHSLNESKKCDNLETCMQRINEELTYRAIYRAVYEDDNTGLSDDDLFNMFGSSEEETKTKDNKDTKSEDNEEVEEVYLSRIEITLVNKKAAEDLKQACIDAEIPEDAIEITPAKEEEEDATEEEPAEEPSEENTTETAEETEEKETPNESFRFTHLKKFLNEAEDAEQDDANDDEKSDDESDDESDNEQYKFILNDTDYAEKLQQVLANNYGITEDEFNDAIGGTMVKEDDLNDEKSDDEKKSDDKKKSDEKSDDDEHDIDPAELFKGL